MGARETGRKSYTAAMGGPMSAMRWLAAMAAALAGVLGQLQQRSLPGEGVHLALVAGGLLCIAVGWRWRRAFALLLVGLVLLGFGSTGWRAAQRLAVELPASLEGRDIRLTGIVASLPQAGANGLRFRFEVESAVLAGEPVNVPRLLSLGWYSGFHEDAVLSQPQRDMRAGQRWTLNVRLRRPHGNLNPHGFDYELQLFEQGVRATGYVRDAPAQRLDDAAAYPVERLRQRVRDAISEHVADRRAAGVLAALAVGEQGAIDGAWQLSATEVTH